MAATMDEAAVSAALDRLAATRSAAEAERLLSALLAARALPELLPRLAQVTSVCVAPPRKAAAVGHTLLVALAAHVSSAAATSATQHVEALRDAQHALLAVVQANAAIVAGVRSALESYGHNEEGAASTAATALAVARPLLVASLLETPPRAAAQLALVQSLVRVAWADTADGADAADARAAVRRVLVRAAALAPLSSDADAWSVYPALVATAADLLAAADNAETDANAGRVARAVLRRVVFALDHDLEVVSLLQSLLALAQAAPRALCASTVVFQLGALLLHAQAGPREQTLVLRVLQVLLPVSRRGVLVEALVAPLVAVQASHPQVATALLKRVLDAAAAAPFQSSSPSAGGVDGGVDSVDGVDAAHGASYLALAASPDACEHWLDSLFQEGDATAPVAIQDAAAPATRMLLQFLGACLVDRRGRVRALALEALDRQLQRRRVRELKRADWAPASVKLLVSMLVVLTSYRPATEASAASTVAATADQLWLSRGFQVLAALAATTTETMKIALRLIKRMAAAADAGLRPQALHLMLLVWKQDSRVYPQLEDLLNQAKDDADKEEDDENDDAAIVRMATILAVCEKDAETGVEWVADVQAFLEHRCASIVAMAARAVALLCVADCLDYETTVKMFVVKLKKNKIACADEPLFQQEMCKLYAFGGACDFVTTSPKYSARVLSDLWEYAEAEDASVRAAAYQALNGYTLEALGLRLVGTSSGKGQAEDDSDDDEDQLTEQDVEENVDRVWTSLQTEQDERVRDELETLVKRILDAECKTLAPGGASRTGTGLASAAAFAALDQRVSAAATKELKKVLPTRDVLVPQVDNEPAAWCAYLLAYEPANVAESGAAAKRKDKRLRAVMGHVDEMKAVLARCLAWSSSSPSGFLELLQSVDAWNSFARKYVGRLEELAVLRTPMDAPEGHTAGVLSSLIDEEISSLAGESNSAHAQRWLVAGAIVHQACLSTSSELLQGSISKARAVFRTQLQQSMEELRVFKDASLALELQHVVLGLAIAYPTEYDSHLDAIVARVVPLVSGDGPELMQAAALLFVTHATSLVRKEETQADQQQRIQTGIECAGGVMLGATPKSRDAVAGLTASLFTSPPNTAKLVDHLKSSASTARASPALAWASAMGLAQLSHRLASVHRLAWLDNLRDFLEGVWQEDPTLVSAVALGPVLLESVHHNRVPIAAVQDFISTLQRRLDEAPADVAVVGAVVLPYVVQRVATYGSASARSDVESFVQSLERGHEGSSVPVLAVAAGNVLHGATGVTLFGATRSPEREVAVETAHAERLVAALNELNKQTQPTVSTAAAIALAAVADRVDSFYVTQKNKAFDIQVNSLPATSLVFKTLEFLRVDGAIASGASGEGVRASQSALGCIAHASRSSPLPPDLAALAIRVASRYALADDVLAACIELAASHASGVSLLMTNLLSPERLLNYSPRVVEASVDAVATARGRLMPLQLVALVTRTLDALVESWRRADDSASSQVSVAFEKWIKLVGLLVETAPSAPGEAAAGVGEGDEDTTAVARSLAALVQNEFWTKLPFTPHQDTSKQLLRLLARDVLSKIAPRNAVTDALVSSTSRSTGGDDWAWWRAGVALVELTRLGAITSSSVVFRWLLQLEFSAVQSASVADAFTADLADAVCVAAGKRSVVEVNEPWILELLDAIARTLDDGASHEAVLKRHVLFATVVNVVSWTELCGHETLLLLCGDATGLPRSAVAASLPALSARALLGHHHERSNASASIALRLWTLQTSGEREAAAKDAVVRELLVVASEARPPLLSSDTTRTLVARLSTA